MENIKSYQYEIILSAPIGDKKGYLTVNIAQGKLDGNLIVMKNKNYFSGIIKPNGNCEISGSIKTLIGSVDYHGEGYVDEQTAMLILNAGKRKLIISRKLLTKEEA